MIQKIIPFSSTELRRQWFHSLGGIKQVSVKNQEWRSLLIDDGRNTLAIEGEFDSKVDIGKVLDKPDYEDVSIKKVINFFEAAINIYEFAFRQWQENEFNIEKGLILSSHAILFRGIWREFSQDPGTWAIGPREISNANFQPIIGAEKIQKKVKYILKILHSLETPPTRKAAIFHSLFEHLHPFPDGNGRVGRILLNFILLAHGLPTVAIKGIKKNDREKYYQALGSADLSADKIINNELSLGEIPPDFSSEMENLIEKYLAVSLDNIICSRFSKKEELIPVRQIARSLGKSEQAFVVACSQKKYICTKKGRQLMSHLELLNPPS